MALQRYTTSVDGTIPVQALLYTDEQLLASQDGVGIYDGLQKSTPHQSGAIHTTSHRIFYIDNKDPEYISFAVNLAYVTQTDYYAGLFTSSPKVTLYLAGRGVAGSSASSTNALAIPSASDHPDFGAWECDVCGNRNRTSPGQSLSSTQVCELCGVPRSSTTLSQTSSIQHLSISLPSTSMHEPTRSRRPSTIACPACTFLNHPSLVECEICGTKLPTITSSGPQQMTKSAPATRPTSPDIDDDDEDPSSGKLMKVSFRKGGDKAFYTILKRAIKSKAWESQASQLYKSNTPTGAEADSNAISRSGITGVLRSVETSAQGQSTDLMNALQDLEALRIKARDMVRLAGELNEKLTSATISPTPTPTQSLSSLALTNNESNNNVISSRELPEETTFIRSSLAQLGLQMSNVPVTSDMINDEDKWINELARELAGVLKGMMRDRGIVALDEVWGGWNRARGVALLPPSTFLQVISHLSQHTHPPIHKRTFKSGLSVLHTPPYAQGAFSDRIIIHLTTGGPKTTMEIAMVEGITVALTKEMIDEAEMNGDVVRDDAECVIQDSMAGGDGVGLGGVGLGVGEAGVRWWPNVFVGYVWDGHTFGG
ncbi:Vacuolar protein-sorting-associated protein 36 [Leucoagaricus sp. SymC.cos]|nr:Vacuolar protein-sorting-associated protein 36 [Leucoagaricus sp. SymC.cos]